MPNLVSLVIPLLASMAIGGTSDGFLLRRRPPKGQTETYEVVTTTGPVLALGVWPENGGVSPTTARYLLRFGTADDGAGFVPLSFGYLDSEGQGSSFRQGQMDGRGQIESAPMKVSRDSLPPGPLLPFPSLPAGKVKPGDEWTFFAQNDAFTGFRPQFGTARLVRVESDPGGLRARVAYRITINADADLTALNSPNPGGGSFPMRFTGPIDCVGMAWIDMSTGRVESAEISSRFTLTLEASSTRTKAQSTGRGKMTIKFVGMEPTHN